MFRFHVKRDKRRPGGGGSGEVRGESDRIDGGWCRMKHYIPSEGHLLIGALNLHKGLG